jgi:hypothetical protein
LGDPISVAGDILLDDAYALGRTARLARLRIHSDKNDQYSVDATSGLGTPGNALHLNCVVTLMSQDGDTVDGFVLVEADNSGEISETYLLPIAQLAKKMKYAVVGIDKSAAHQKLAQAACASFTRGTHITTATGAQVAIENLVVGDRVLTQSDGVQEIRWIGQNTVRAVGPFAPVRISAGTFDNERDLVIGPDHILFLCLHTNLQWGRPGDSPVKARHLINGTSVQTLNGGFVDYFQLLFDSHQIVFAEGIPAETLRINSVTRPALPENISRLVGLGDAGYAGQPDWPDPIVLLRGSSTQ